MCCSCAFIALVLFHTVALRAYIVVQPAVRAPVAAAPQVAPAAANEWGITLEDSSVDDASAASGGAVLPEGLFYAFERSAAQPSSSASSSSPSGGSAAGAGDSVEDLMAALKGL